MYHRQLFSVRRFPTAIALRTLTDFCCRSLLQNYYAPILTVLLTRLQNSRTETFALRFVRFYHFIAARDDKGLGADFFINVSEQVQSGYADFPILCISSTRS